MKEGKREITKRSRASFTGNRSDSVARNLSGRTRRHRVEDSSEREYRRTVEKGEEKRGERGISICKKKQKRTYDESSGDQQGK